MRALAAAFALVFALAALTPHVHASPRDGDEQCVLCQVRAVDAASDAVPDVAPTACAAGEAVRAPGLPPVTGAPLGAVPGQSPPV